MSKNNNMVLRTLYISVEMDEALRRYAFDHRLTKSFLIRKFVEDGFNTLVDIETQTTK